MFSLKRSLTLVGTTLFIASPFVVYVERQNMYDWWRLRNYDAPAKVVSLADDTTMGEYARKLFYVSHPELQSREAFREKCTIFEKTIVLGCYRSNDGIYIYNVSDARLSGVLQVTSAHEMLHVAYDRLSKKERERIDGLTQTAYLQLSDKRVIKNVESYRSRDVNVVPNELHSILGTEVRDLPDELEAYYAQYFLNRSKIVDYSEQYEAEFINREAAVATYDVQLKEMKQTITSLTTSLESQSKVIEAENDRLEALLKQRNIDTYNASIPNYQAMITEYNQGVATLKSTISAYNEMVDKRNSIVTEEQELMNAIDSSAPATM